MSGAAPMPAIALDHLVVACRSLDAGRAWCEATLGVAPQPGGRHALMGTHNLLLSLASERYPKAYLELIAIDPEAPAPARPRWFDLDDAVAAGGDREPPRLVHWVARSDDVEATVAALRAGGADPGRIVAAERMTPHGMLRWRITLARRRPAAGGRGGAALIEWSGEHPSDALPPSGVAIECDSKSAAITGTSLAARLRLARPSSEFVVAARDRAVLSGPRGRVRSTSPAAATTRAQRLKPQAPDEAAPRRAAGRVVRRARVAA